MSTGDDNLSAGALAQAATRSALQEPPRYRVVMLNDDFTPMEFVVEVLMLFFHMDEAQATRVMLQVHTEGRAVCGHYPRDIAETKAGQVNRFARASEHPLLCEVESAGSGIS